MKEIKILGTGCPNCKILEKNVREAVKALNLDVTISKVTDIMDIMAYKIPKTPGVVIDEEVVSSGKVLSVEDAIRILNSN